MVQLFNFSRERGKRLFNFRWQSRPRRKGGGAKADTEMSNWLTGGAIIAIVGAAMGVGIFGHIQTLGALAWFAIPLTVGVEVYCARATAHLDKARTRAKRAAVIGLLGVCSIVAVIFEHRGLEAVNSISNATYSQAFSERAEALEIKAALGSDYNSLPALPADPAALASMNTRALNRIEATRDAWERTTFNWHGESMTQLEALNRATVEAAKPLPPQLAEPLSDAALWFIVGFIFCIRMFGFWTIQPPGADVIALRPAPEKEPPPAVRPGAALVAKRWAKRDAERQAALARQAG